ncbi:MAG: hypothetical protein WCG84_01995, partial [Candidatus Moraniibacteriota bacterium]
WNGTTLLGQNRITNVATPTDDYDAVNLKYVKAASGGGCYEDYGMGLTKTKYGTPGVPFADGTPCRAPGFKVVFFLGEEVQCFSGGSGPDMVKHPGTDGSCGPNQPNYKTQVYLCCK